MSALLLPVFVTLKGRRTSTSPDPRAAQFLCPAQRRWTHRPRLTLAYRNAVAIPGPPGADLFDDVQPGPFDFAESFRFLNKLSRRGRPKPQPLYRT